MSHTPELIEYTSHPPETTDPLENALFHERLDTFMQKSLAEIQAFAERESKSYDETRRIIAEWHAKALFSVRVAGRSCSADSDELEPEERNALVRDILIETSKVLESLSEVLGVQSFILAVDTQDPQDAGFLGGSLVGREFYRGLRGGGTAGASSFKSFAQKRLPSAREETVVQDVSTRSSPAPPATRSARQIKVDLYEAIRSQLRRVHDFILLKVLVMTIGDRQVSGIRKADMKWTNPERLSLYGVRLVGWPPDIPAANPSSLKANQNQRLLELVEHGELRFEKTMIIGLEAPEALRHTPETTAEDFSWAYTAQGDDGDKSIGSSTATGTAAKSLPEPTSSLASGPADRPILSGSPDILPDSLESEFTWNSDVGDDLLEAQHNAAAGLDEYEFNIDPWNGAIEEAESPIEQRARKRARSSEP